MTSYRRKTDRIHGAISKAIRKVAAKGNVFDRTHIKGAWSTPQITRMLLHLARSGELKRVKKGKAGKPVCHAMYQRQ